LNIVRGESATRWSYCVLVAVSPASRARRKSIVALQAPGKPHPNWPMSMTLMKNGPLFTAQIWLRLD